MIIRDRDIGGEFLESLAKQGVFVDGRGTFKVGDTQVPRFEQKRVAALLRGAVNRVTREAGAEVVSQINNSGGHQRVLGDVVEMLRSGDVELLRRFG